MPLLPPRQLLGITGVSPEIAFVTVYVGFWRQEVKEN
jgi:hypothetical protein